jgi:hypothetical protein
MPPMLSAIVGDLLAAEEDFVVVGRTQDHEDPLRLARANGADMVITHQGSGAGTCIDAILSGPPLSIFAIDGDGRAGSALTLAREPVALGAAAPALPDAIRRIARGG